MFLILVFSINVIAVNDKNHTNQDNINNLNEVSSIKTIFNWIINKISSIRGNILTGAAIINTNDITLNNTLNETVLNLTGLKLATVVNNQSINTPYIRTYLGWYNNFSDVDFEPVTTEKVSTVMKVGNTMDDVRGYKLNNENYVIHLLGCDDNTNACFFQN